jgi:hypothetical protein
MKGKMDFFGNKEYGVLMTGSSGTSTSHTPGSATFNQNKNSM